ncbi:histone-fold-containing protein [Coniophora puteana RWD-64-598 SS2]|uniref:Histone-fold-containing protein n=1 Tax=Coniophora puteana (strain RWD-64-598) TaxID=741705 RepID=A0A5M3MQE9_CONPW|nr:histone-fold-containing protein [Coniophora puteana RWD-64-598 SS2]EIW81286.1 histone-fold-containing protein [Coniophora puteana RWD-64-598 SS2]
MISEENISQANEAMETQSQPDLVGEDTQAFEDGADEAGPAQKSSSKKDKAPAQRERDPGKSLLPFSRVQKIIKADKDLPIVAKDATLLISLATEEFIKRLSGACHRLAEQERRATVQQRDVATIVRRADEFLFLDGTVLLC